MQWRELDSGGMWRMWLEYTIRGLPNEDRKVQGFARMIRIAIVLYFFTMAGLFLNALVNDGVDLLYDALFPVHWALIFAIGFPCAIVLPRMDQAFKSAMRKYAYFWLDVDPIVIPNWNLSSSLLAHFSTHSIDEPTTKTITSISHHPRNRYVSYEFNFDESTELDILYNEDLGAIENVLFRGKIEEPERNEELMRVILKYFKDHPLLS